MPFDKRVLIVSYNYPPVGTVGSLRVTKITGRLPSLGWYPTVMSVTKDISKPSSWDETEGEFPEVKVVRAPFLDPLTFVQRALRKAGLLSSNAQGGGKEGKSSEVSSVLKRFVRWLARWGTFPDRYLLWVPSALIASLKELETEGYSLIFSTSPPLSNHFVAYLLSRLKGIPWVADLRDPWAHGYLDLSSTEIALHKRLERAVLRRASAVTAVYDSLAREIERDCRMEDGSVVHISIGFDPLEYPYNVSPTREKFVLTFTGSVYGLKQDPRPLFEVIEELIDEGSICPEEIVVRFYGPPDESLEKLRDTLRYPEIMEVHGVVKRREVLMRQRESSALLVLLWDNPYTAKYFGGKVFEYLGAKRPILAWCPAGGEIVSLLERSGAGVAVTSKNELKEVLRKWVRQYMENGEIELPEGSTELSSYHWDRIASRMVEVFDRVISAK